jgi:DNA polymerase-3 subunit alpha
MVTFNSRSFTHLNVHSHYTLMGSTASIPALVERAVADGLTHLALTDTHALYGAVQFAQACEQAGLQPLIGMSIQVALPTDNPAHSTKPWGKLVLLAMEPSGYTSLCRLSSAIQLQFVASAPEAVAVPWELLAVHKDGLLAIEGGREGWLESLVRQGDSQAVSKYLGRLTGLFGEAFSIGLEVQPATDEMVTREVLDLSSRFGALAVPMMPVYCMVENDRPRLRLMAAIQHNTRLQEVPASTVPGSDDPGITVHWLAPEAMAERYKFYAGSLADMSSILQACERRVLPSGKAIWPAIELPQGQTPIEALRAKAKEGLKALYVPHDFAAAEARLEHELNLIGAGGFAPLFLLVADIARRARETGIPINTRGSVANSLTAYAIGITNVDPLEHELLFERFLNPERADLPDIDLDFCSRRRDELLDYLRETYGEDHVAMVATIQTMQPRSAVRETAKAYGYDEAAIKRLTKGIARWWHPDPRRRGRRGVETAVEEARNPVDRRILQAAQGIVGQPRHLSVHPGGVVITPGPLTDVVPVQPAPKGILITQYPHEDVEAIGLPKVDLLGIRALSVISRSVDRVRASIDPTFDLDAIPMDDPVTGDLLERGETIGVFQCESEGAQTTLRKLRARTVKDLAVANAFFKPGPATGGMAGAFVRRYRGEEAVDFLHPALEPILRSTQGVLLFQEQILRVATEVAGMAWEDANQLRRGMTKFRPEQMEALRERFIRGCRRRPPDGPGFSETEANTLWEQVHAFAGYGFNKGHATSYAAVSYRMAYLKGHFPAAFVCARLSEQGGYHHPAVYIAEALRLGIEVRPPHVNHSGTRFQLAIEDQGALRQPVLWMGLNQVRDLRRTSIQRLLKARVEGSFTGVADLARRVPLQARELAHLVQCGALDGLIHHRAAGLVEAEGLERGGSHLQRSFDFLKEEPGAVEKETARQRLEWERHVLGMPVSVHPLEAIPEPAPGGIPLQQVADQPGKKVITLGARLPGWSRGRSFFLSDPEFFLPARLPKESPITLPPAWAPLRVEGAWREDAWGGGWFELVRIQRLDSESV